MYSEYAHTIFNDILYDPLIKFNTVARATYVLEKDIIMDTEHTDELVFFVNGKKVSAIISGHVTRVQVFATDACTCIHHINNVCCDPDRCYIVYFIESILYCFLQQYIWSL